MKASEFEGLPPPVVQTEEERLAAAALRAAREEDKRGIGTHVPDDQQ